ncbi:MAG: ABC transporter permease [Pseudomonadota bacterium]
MRIDLRTVLLDMRIASKGLRVRRFRSTLSALGVGIGVLALVAMLSISEGANREIQQKIASLGTDTIRIDSQTSKTGTRAASELNLSQGLSIEDAEFLSNANNARVTIAPYWVRNQVRVSAQSKTASATIIGSSPSWFSNERLTIVRGRSLRESDLRTSAKRCVIGSTIAARLQLTVGDIATISTMNCQIVGVLHPKGALLTEGTGIASLNFDEIVVMPWSSFALSDMAEETQKIDGIVARVQSVRDESDVFAAAESLRGHLNRRHRGVQDYRIVVPLTLLQEARQTQTLFQLIMGSIAGLSLLVGGIGVMNIMLANVSEQTREIGLRMAVGATRLRIVTLYLCHAVLLCLAGSVCGILLGVFVALLVQWLVGWPVAFAIESLILGPLLALSAGIIFGLHPALVASRLNPVAALRDL